MRAKPIAIKVILVEPAGALNLGSVARLCENFGVDELRLVAPRCDPDDPEAKRMAVRGAKFLKAAETFSCLLDAISDCRRVIATCGRIDHGTIPLNHPEEALPWLINTSKESPVALVFGREDRGLTNQELLLAQKVITIETSPQYPSLNLSHAVAVVLHELNRSQRDFSTSNPKDKLSHQPASPVELNECLEETKELLLRVGFLLDHTAEARMTKIRGLLQRAEIRPEEVAMIRGILRQIRWAIKTSHS